jgi:hypothetical protein
MDAIIITDAYPNEAILWVPAVYQAYVIRQRDWAIESNRKDLLADLEWPPLIISHTLNGKIYRNTEHLIVPILSLERLPLTFFRHYELEQRREIFRQSGVIE